MPDCPGIVTERLLLRRWRESDREPFAALNADPQVMAYFPARLQRAASDALVDRIEAHFEQHGYGFWALQALDTGRFLGFTGLAVTNPAMPFDPGAEVGWRLIRSAWGQGYATEAGRAALTYGFAVLGLPEVVSFTAATNLRSQAVMQRLGMTRNPAGDFDHPAVEDGHPLRRHVLYRISPPITNS